MIGRTLQRLGVSRNVFFAGLTSFFTDTATKLAYSVMPLFLLSMGASRTAIASIEGIAESTASLMKVLAGSWSDRIGRRKPFMLFGYGMTAAIIPAYSLSRSPLQVLILRFMERIGKGVRAAPRDSLISASLARQSMGAGFGLHKAMDNSGAIIGPLVAAVLLIIFPQRYALILALGALPALLGVLTIAICIREVRSADSVSPPPNPSRTRKLPRRFLGFLAVVFVFTLGNSTDALLLIKAADSGIAAPAVPFLYMIFNALSVLLSIPAGRMSDKIGRERMILSGFFVYAFTYTLFGIGNGGLALWIPLFMLYGTYQALTDSSLKAMVADLIPPESRGRGFGIYHAVQGITLLPASIVAGLLYDQVGSSAPFFFGGFMSLLAASLLMAGRIYRQRRLSATDKPKTSLP